MEAIEYVLGLTSVIIGLALSDVIVSFHRLIRNTTTVKWDVLPLFALAIVVATLMLAWLSMWWARESLQGVGLLASVLPELIIAFLMAAAVLPDDPTGHFDLREFYERSARYLWGLFALYQLSSALHSAWLWSLNDMPTSAFIPNLLIRLGQVPLALALAWLPLNRRLHWIILTPLTLVTLGLLMISSLS